MESKFRVGPGRASAPHPDQVPDKFTVFVNYSCPSQFNDKRRRWVVSSNAASHARRRTKVKARFKVEAKNCSKDSEEFANGRTAGASTDGEAQDTAIGRVQTVVYVTNIELMRVLLSADSRATVAGSSIGGLRSDPFNAFPIPATDCVPRAVDYYLQIFAPGKMPAGSPPGAHNPMLNTFWPLALQHGELFEALVALAQSFFAMNYKIKGWATKEVRWHRISSMKRLRTKLLAKDAIADDAAMITTILLMGVEYLAGDDQNFAAHLRGLYQMARRRGGLFGSGMNEDVKASILHVQMMGASLKNRRSDEGDPVSLEILEYPRHPFRPDICAMVARMPVGFRDLALEGRISIEMMKVLEQVSLWFKSSKHQQVGQPKYITKEDKLVIKRNQCPLHHSNSGFCLSLSKSHYDHPDDLPNPNGTNMECCLSLGLIALNLIVLQRPPASLAYPGLLQQLAKKLITFRPKLAEVDCVLWLLVVTLGACRDCQKSEISQSVAVVIGACDWESEWAEQKWKIIETRFLPLDGGDKVWHAWRVAHMASRRLEVSKE